MSDVQRALSSRVPSVRLQPGNAAPVRARAKFVLYWMSASRRVGWNFGLQRAADWARALGKPLVVVETLPSGCRWSSARHHTFVLQGMAESARRLERAGVRYYPYVEPKRGRARELLRALAAEACAVVTDDFPIVEASEETAAVAGQVSVLLEKVDSCGLLPMRAADHVFPTAYAFRRFLQRALPDHLMDAPKANPLARAGLRRLRSLPGEIRRRWAPASSKLLAGDAGALASLPIDHAVGPVAIEGGSRAASRVLKQFLSKKLARYPLERNEPEKEATSGLSPYLHFGHVSVHEIFHELAKAEGWSPTKLSEKATGKREGWWGMSQAAEAFLDELVTWREVGFNRCALCKDYGQYASLPDWAQKTLREHASDRREHVYSPEEFENARTHDPLWNAAQMQIVGEGRMHNYLRMLWGKKILQWTACPQDAADVMIELNNRYGLDGHDPNSYSGIFWVLGRYDRPWGPERPIFGKIRYMSSENTARKVRVKDYIVKYSHPVG
jgi:deoxyribodipyrimidine photo-lyase